MGVALFIYFIYFFACTVCVPIMRNPIPGSTTEASILAGETFTCDVSHVAVADTAADLERQADMAELEQLKKRVAELEEKLKVKKKGGLKFKVHVPVHW